MTDKIDFGGEPWRAIPRSTLRDPRLSLKARGALTTLLSHEEGWVRSVIATLMHESSTGRAGAQSAMKELVQAGYATWERQQDPATGQFRTTYTVSAISQQTGAEPGDSPQTGNPSTDSPQTGNHPVVVEALDVEHQDEEPKALELAPTARRRDPIWDVLVELYGDPTSSGKGAMNAAAKVLRDYHATAADIRWMAHELHGTDVAWAVATPSSLAKHFGSRHQLFNDAHGPHVYDHAAAIARGEA